MRKLTAKDGRTMYVEPSKIIYSAECEKGSIIQYETGWVLVKEAAETISKRFKKLTQENGKAIFVNRKMILYVENNGSGSTLQYKTGWKKVRETAEEVYKVFYK